MKLDKCQNLGIEISVPLLTEKVDILNHEIVRQINISLHSENNKPNYLEDIHKSVEKLKDKIVKESVGDWNAGIINKAPMLVVQTYVRKRSGFERDGSFTTSKEDRWENFDAGIACEAFCLAAHEAGLGTVIMGMFDDSKVAGVLGLSEDLGVASLIAIGHPAVSPEAPKRKEVSEILSFRS